MSILIDNKTPFALKIYRAGENGAEKFSNLLGGHQTYVQEAKIGDRFSVRLLLDDDNEVLAITASETHHDLTIRHTDLRSQVRRAEPGTIGIPENILCDLYLVKEDGEWELGDSGINPNEAPFIDAQPGQLLVGTVPDDKEAVLFWAYVYDPGDSDPWADEIAYNVHVVRNFLRGTVSSNGFHVFEDERVTRERLLPSGLPQLFEGEVLVYQSPNYDQDSSGAGNYFWIFNTNIADISIYAPPVKVDQQWSPPAITARSFIPGPGTAVTICSEADYGGDREKSDTKIEDKPINSLMIDEVTPATQVGLRLLTDLSEDTDAAGKDVTRFRTTLAFHKPRWQEGKIAWPSVRFQAEAPSSAYVNREAAARQLDPVQWTDWVAANDSGRVQVSQPPLDKLHAPALFMQTDEMADHHVVAFHPSLALHHRLQDKFGGGSGDIKNNREALGIETDPKKLPDEACDAVQKAALNISRMAVPNVSQDSRAIHATHRVNGSNMEHRHFHFSLGDDGHPRYVPMSKQEHADKIGTISNRTADGIQDMDQQIEASFLDDVGGAFEDAGGWVKDRAEDVGDGVVDGYNYAKDGVVHIVVSVKDRVEHTVEAVVHYVKEGIEKAVRFAIKTVEVIGAFVKKVFDAIKLAIEAVIDFIKFLIALVKDIIAVYHQVNDALTGQIDTWKQYIKDQLNEEAVISAIQSVEDFALQPFSAEARAHAHHGSSPLQSALEKVEWLYHVIANELEKLVPGGAAQAAEGFLLEVEETIIETVAALIEDAVDTFLDIVQNPQDAGQDMEELGVNLVRDVFDGIKKIASSGVTFFQENVDALDPGSVWDIPLVSYFKTLLPDLSPVNVVSAFFAVPVGIVYATEDIDPDDLTLSFGWNEALLVFSGIGDYAKILTSTAKTFKLAEESSRTTSAGSEPGPSGVDGKLFEFFGYIDTTMTACTIAAGVYRRGTGAMAILTDIAGAAAGIGYLFSKSKVKKKGAKAAAQFDVILDAVMSIVAGIGSILNFDDYLPIIRAAMILEAIAGLLELAGFTKNEEVVLGAMAGQAVLFASAGTMRLAAEAQL